jgi:hypothetical protein
MTDPILSDPGRLVAELIQSSDVLRPIVTSNPDLVAIFIRATNVAARMSSDRERLIAAITRAADTSDRVLEAIQQGKAVELAERLLVAAQAIDDLGAALQEFVPIAVAPIAAATRGAASSAPN